MSHAPGRLPGSPASAPGLGRAPKTARDLPDELSARRLLSRGQAVTGTSALAAIVGVVGFLLATGQSRALRDLAVTAIAAATFAYVVVIAFRLALVAIGP